MLQLNLPHNVFHITFSSPCPLQTILDSSLDGSVGSHQSENDRHSSAYLSGVSMATIVLSVVLAIQVV